jgi:hypothetical protein
MGYVQSKLALPASSSTPAATFTTANNVAGNLIIAVFFGASSVTINSVTDSNSNAYKFIVTDVDAGAAAQLTIYYASGIKAGANTVTFNLSGATTPELVIVEVSGVSIVDQSTHNQGNSANVASGSLTAKYQTGYAFCYSGASNNLTVGSGWTQRENDGGGGIAEDQLITAGGSFNGTATQTSGLWQAGLVLFAGVPPFEQCPDMVE